ncbi:MAG: Rrf2 family transcriptional regulator [Pirellulaceae bacterium]|nr:Rrf2 family transcriptional regulator [Pirellulaceae bacterium]
MNISAKTEYACIAVLELAARHDDGEPVRIRDIADAHGIPSRFLVQILLQLKTAGLVNSVRGATGGYKLARDPEQITLHEVMSVVDSQSGQIKSSTTRATPTTRVLLHAWRKVAQEERDMLSDVTFAGLVRQLQTQPDPMYYI